MQNIVLYYSTNGRDKGRTFREALLEGLAEDGGLYMPDHIPLFSSAQLRQLRSLSYPELAAAIVSRYTDDFKVGELITICNDAYNFEIPLEYISGRKFILRLDRGPTASFKDFAARLMSRLMQRYIEKENKNLTILAATSGDTGSAVASAFSGMNRIKVIILFPSKEVSGIQRKQMTTIGGNVVAIEVDGKFDDCQALVKKAFTDDSLRRLNLSSANSINIGRLIPQSVYYFYAWAQLTGGVDEQAVFSVPSGNFGNLTAGVFAMRMGLPVKKFVIATNENREVPDFLASGEYRPIVPSVNCISSAMNVGHPSNLARLIALYGGEMEPGGFIRKQPDMDKMRDELTGYWYSDEETRNVIREVYKSSGALLEPHGAAAWKGANDYQSAFGDDHPVIVLETAHPGKFPEAVGEITGRKPDLPKQLEALSLSKEEYLSIGNNYEELKDLLLRNNY